MSMHNTEQIWQELANLVRQTFPEHEYSGTVGPHTRFFADLGMASIDAVVLAEKIEEYYGRKMPFATFLAGLRQRGATDLELGELVAFLQAHLNR
jgi:acyl carrier protein